MKKFLFLIVAASLFAISSCHRKGCPTYSKANVSAEKKA